MDNEEKAKKLIEFVLNNEVGSYDLYEYIYDKQTVQSFFNYSTLHKIDCCARNIFNVLIYFAENIERLNKKEEITMSIMHMYNVEDKEKKEILDSYFTFEINTEYCLKYYCKINDIEDEGGRTCSKMMDELEELVQIQFVHIRNFEEPMACKIINNFLDFDLIRDHEALNTEMRQNAALCLGLSELLGESNHDDILGITSESMSGALREHTNKIKIKIDLCAFFHIFSSVSYKTKQLNKFISKSEGGKYGSN